MAGTLSTPRQALARDADRARAAAENMGPNGPARLRVLLKRAQHDLDERLKKAEGLGGPGADSFTATHLNLTLQQVRAVLHNMRGDFVTNLTTAGKELAEGRATGLVKYAEKAEAAYQGITRPLAINEVRVIDSAVAGTESSMLRRILTDPNHKGQPGIMDRYGSQVVGNFETQLQLHLLARRTWAETRDAMTEQSPFLKGAPAHWAERIVRTELMYAQNRSSFEAIGAMDEQLGDVVKVLSATFDNRTAADSYAVHGEIRRPAEPFESWFGAYMHPPNRPNDREVVVMHRISWPIPESLKPKSDAQVAQAWAREGHKGSPPPRPKMTTVDLALFGKTAPPPIEPAPELTAPQKAEQQMGEWPSTPNGQFVAPPPELFPSEAVATSDILGEDKMWNVFKAADEMNEGWPASELPRAGDMSQYTQFVDPGAVTMWTPSEQTLYFDKEKMLAALGSEGIGDWPVLVKKDGTLYAIKGAETIAAHKMLGKDEVGAFVYDADAAKAAAAAPAEPETPDWAAKADATMSSWDKHSKIDDFVKHDQFEHIEPSAIEKVDWNEVSKYKAAAEALELAEPHTLAVTAPQTVSVDELASTTPYVDKNSVLKAIEKSPHMPDLTDVPVVVVTDGKKVLLKGHASTVAAKLMGLPTVDAYVYDDDAAKAAAKKDKAKAAALKGAATKAAKKAAAAAEAAGEQPAAAEPKAPLIGDPGSAGITELHDPDKTIAWNYDSDLGGVEPKYGLDEPLNGVPFDTAPARDWKSIADKPIDEPPLPELTGGKKMGSGLIIVEDDGRAWIVEPKGHYGGYEHTWPKGKQEAGLSLQQNALKEAFEESGLHAEITGHIGDFAGDTSVARYYIAKRTGGAPWKAHSESQGVKLATLGDAATLLNKDRDKKILAALEEHLSGKTNQKGDAATILHEKTGGAAGSNEGGFYTGKDGVKRYVKFYDDPTQAASEHLSNAIYRDLGLGAPKSQLFEHNGKIAYASEIMEGKTLGKAGVTKARAEEFLKGTAADILTGNWDAAGTGKDNAFVTKSGKVIRIDAGGTFLHRAQGARKPASAIHEISEAKNLFDPTVNRDYHEIAKTAGVSNIDDMGKKLKSQVAKIKDLVDRSGGWDKYVNRVVGESMPAADKAQVISMLEARTNLLDEKAKEYAGGTPEPKRPASKGLNFYQHGSAGYAKDIESATNGGALQRQPAEWVKKIAKKADLPQSVPESISALVGSWTSGGRTSPTQRAVYEGFKKYQRGEAPETEKERVVEQAMATRKKRWKAMLENLGHPDEPVPEFFDLHRGMHGDKFVKQVAAAWADDSVDTVKVETEAVASWSHNTTTADDFGGAKAHTKGSWNGVTFNWKHCPFENTIFDQTVDDGSFITGWHHENEVIAGPGKGDLLLPKHDQRVHFKDKTYTYDQREELLDALKKAGVR